MILCECQLDELHLTWENVNLSNCNAAVIDNNCSIFGIFKLWGDTELHIVNKCEFLLGHQLKSLSTTRLTYKSVPHCVG